MADEIRVQGLSEALLVLKALPDRLQRRGLQAATAAGARVIAAHARRIARGAFSQRTGATVRGIRSGKGKRPSQFAARYIIGVKHMRTTHNLDFGRSKRAGDSSGRDMAKRGQNPYYFRFLELGTRRMRARPFLLPGLLSASSDAVSKMRDRLWVEMRKLVRRK